MASLAFIFCERAGDAHAKGLARPDAEQPRAERLDLLVHGARAPAPIASMVMTEATPMMMPSMVSSERSRLARTDCSATTISSPRSTAASLLSAAAGCASCRRRVPGGRRRRHRHRHRRPAAR